MIFLVLSLIILTLLLLGFVESYFHNLSVSNIPHRIHVNGTRGKSSVVRLIAAGLREGGMKVFAKTTGSCPRVIDHNGIDHEIVRLRSASIGEQIKYIRKFSSNNPDVIVMECMAVNPQYQWISEHDIVKSNLGVITNSRPDHIDEMGHNLKQITYSLCNTIPKNSKIFTSEKNMIKQIEQVASQSNSEVYLSDCNSIDSSDLEKFSYIEHADNISLALDICSELGVEKNKAFKGMLKANPDPGALRIVKFNNSLFINAFAANDPESTVVIWEMIKGLFGDKKSCIFLNTRADRNYRTRQLFELVNSRLNPDMLIIRGDNIDTICKGVKINKSIIIKNEPRSITPSEMVNGIWDLKDYFIFGVGNIVGWGDTFINELNLRRDDNV